jgi:hypothetical protein
VVRAFGFEMYCVVVEMVVAFGSIIAVLTVIAETVAVAPDWP